jgi:hypothetical protein
MDDLIAGAQDFLANKEAGALAKLNSGLAADKKATQLLSEQVAQCVTPARSPTPATAPASAASTVPPAAQPAQLTTTELTAHLLTLASLPSGVRQTSMPHNFPTSSDKPACLTTLDALSVASPPTTTITQAGTAFTAGPAGPDFEEVLRSYPPQDAVPAFAAITHVLDGCRRFAVAWTNPTTTGTETVEPTGPVDLGRQSWSAAIVVTEASIPIYETLVLVQADSSLIIVQVASPGGPPTALARAITSLASAKLSAP